MRRALTVRLRSGGSVDVLYDFHPGYDGDCFSPPEPDAVEYAGVRLCSRRWAGRTGRSLRHLHRWGAAYLDRHGPVPIEAVQDSIADAAEGRWRMSREESV